jgi:hypothetical protein
MSYLEEDTRKSQRYFYVTPLHYEGEGKYKKLEALSINISRDGIYFQANNVLPVGHQFILQFKVPGSEEILEAKCEVIHNSEVGGDSNFAIGCRINDIKGMKKEDLTKKLLEAFGEDPNRLY